MTLELNALHRLAPERTALRHSAGASQSHLQITLSSHLLPLHPSHAIFISAAAEIKRAPFYHLDCSSPPERLMASL